MKISTTGATEQISLAGNEKNNFFVKNGLELATL